MSLNTEALHPQAKGSKGHMIYVRSMFLVGQADSSWRNSITPIQDPMSILNTAILSTILMVAHAYIKILDSSPKTQDRGESRNQAFQHPCLCGRLEPFKSFLDQGCPSHQGDTASLSIHFWKEAVEFGFRANLRRLPCPTLP